jgi:hypothetical protein
MRRHSRFDASGTPRGSSLRRLPGADCRFHHAGRCLYEEWLNPGLHDGYRCMAVKAWMREHDEFLRRAEAFHLDEPTAAAMWRRKMERLADLERTCPQFRPAGDVHPLECGWRMEDLCLAALPSCQGKCSHFKPMEDKAHP